MKRRYYMRGIGISMIVTAILMGVAGGKGETLSDEEIKFRAAKLGMVEERPSVLTDLRTTLPTVTETSEPAETEKPVETSKPIETAKLVETNKPIETAKPVETSKPTETPQVIENLGTTDEKESVTIEIKRGDSSVSLSRDLKEAGLIQDAKAYDKYLCSNGYDRKISVGVYQIPVGSSEEEIAKIVTKSKR